MADPSNPQQPPGPDDTNAASPATAAEALRARRANPPTAGDKEERSTDGDRHDVGERESQP